MEERGQYYDSVLEEQLRCARNPIRPWPLSSCPAPLCKRDNFNCNCLEYSRNRNDPLFMLNFLMAAKRRLVETRKGNVGDPGDVDLLEGLIARVMHSTTNIQNSMALIERSRRFIQEATRKLKSKHLSNEQRTILFKEMQNHVAFFESQKKQLRTDMSNAQRWGVGVAASIAAVLVAGVAASAVYRNLPKLYTETDVRKQIETATDALNKDVDAKQTVLKAADENIQAKQTQIDKLSDELAAAKKAIADADIEGNKQKLKAAEEAKNKTEADLSKARTAFKQVKEEKKKTQEILSTVKTRHLTGGVSLGWNVYNRVKEQITGVESNVSTLRRLMDGVDDQISSALASGQDTSGLFEQKSNYRKQLMNEEMIQTDLNKYLGTLGWWGSMYKTNVPDIAQLYVPLDPTGKPVHTAALESYAGLMKPHSK